MPPSRQPEQLIGALVPTALPRPRPAPAPVAELPPGASVDPATVVFATSRVAANGRITARAVLRAVGWSPGDRIDIAVAHATIVITPAARGRHVIRNRGEIGLPAAARQMCRIAPGSLVLLALLTESGLLVIHPAATIARLLRTRHIQLIGDHYVR